MTLADQIAQAAGEMAAGAAGTDPRQMTALVEALATANQIAAFGCGREGLMMRALAKRLYHLGLDVDMVGDMSCPPLAQGDLLLVLVLSRIRAAPSARLGHLAFEGQGAFSSQC